MRIEVIKCDECKKEWDAQYVLPREWVTLKQGSDMYGGSEERHLCSTECLITWAKKQGIEVKVEQTDEDD